MTTKVNIISGFLGSGKTTVISNLLNNKPDNERWAVIINEFGKVAIDYLVLKDKLDASDEIIEVAGGCICCSSRDMFQENLDEILEKQKPDRIIIEPTGLGGLQSVKSIIVDYSALELKSIICLVDVNATDNPRLVMNPIFRSQIHDSDIIFISKSDLDESGEIAGRVSAWLTKEFPPKSFYGKLFNGELPLNMLDFDSDQNTQSISAPSVVGMFAEKETFTQVEEKYSDSYMFNVNDLKVKLENTPDLYRAKGVINTTSGKLSFNYVSGVFNTDTTVVEDENIIVAFFTSPPSENALSNLAE